MITNEIRLVILNSSYSQPMGVYGTSTWYQGVNPTPTAHPPASSSKCQTYLTITASPLCRCHNGLVRCHPKPTAFPGSNRPAPPPST